MNIFNIENAFRLKKERNWDCIYWMIDIHQTILEGKYASTQDYEISKECVQVLQWISRQPDHKIIIWTSSYAKDYDRLKQYLYDKYNITVDYHNENPECGNTNYADFTTKPYFNILLEDKSGFSIETDWTLIGAELERITKDKIIEWDQNSLRLLTIGVASMGNNLDKLLK